MLEICSLKRDNKLPWSFLSWVRWEVGREMLDTHPLSKFPGYATVLGPFPRGTLEQLKDMVRIVNDRPVEPLVSCHRTCRFSIDLEKRECILETWTNLGLRPRRS